MNETNDEPIWEHLPADPEKFFGLADDFKRNDLKRGYTKLIKRFKPDKFPREFQLIRAAFEELDQRLRFGKSPADVNPRVVLDQAASGPSQPSNTTGQRASAVESARRVALQNSPVEAYRLLENKAQKTVEDYYALAALSDVVPGDAHFADWIISGLECFPDDVRLLRLLDSLYRFCRIEADTNDRLVRLSQIHAKDSFFVLTESVWHRLLHALPFDGFAELLQACESNIRDIHVHARTVFYLQLLRAAMFKASDSWIERVAHEIQENYQLIPEYLEVDLEVTLALVEYRKAQGAFQNGNSLRNAIHGAMKSYCEAGDAEGCRAVAELQVSNAGKWEPYAEAFPMDGMDHRAALNAWHWVSWDVSQKILIPDSRDHGVHATESTEKYMQWAHDQNHNTVSSNTLPLAILVILGTPVAIAALLLGGATYAAIGPRDYPDSIVIFMLVGIGIASMLFRMLAVPPVRRFAARRRDAICGRLYNSVWRPGFFRLINSNNGDAQEICRSANAMAVANSAKSFPVLHEIAKRTSTDVGLQFYGTTFLFVH